MWWRGVFPPPWNERGSTTDLYGEVLWWTAHCPWPGEMVLKESKPGMWFIWSITILYGKFMKKSGHPCFILGWKGYCLQWNIQGTLPGRSECDFTSWRIPLVMCNVEDLTWSGRILWDLIGFIRILNRSGILVKMLQIYSAFHKTFDKRFPKFNWNSREFGNFII